MRTSALLAAAALALPAAALAQSSNTSSNSSSNNGVVRERIVDTYCDSSWCERQVVRRTYRDAPRRHRYDRGERRYERLWERRDRDDDD